MAGHHLTTQEKQICRQIFDRFDKDKNGTIDVAEIKSALKAIGQPTSDEDLFLVMSEADADNSGVIEFAEFLKAIEKQKMAMEMSKDENATIDAFVALGGNADKSGKISLDKLRSVLHEFDLMQNVQLFDKDGSGFIEFEEFKEIVDQVLTRRTVLTSVTLGISLQIIELPALAEYRIESLIPEGIDFGVVKDPVLAYEFLYPKQYLSGTPLPVAFYRRPAKYSSVAPQSVEGRQHIVCGLGAFGQGVTVTVSVGPPPDSMPSDAAQWTPTTVANAVLSDRSLPVDLGGSVDRVYRSVSRLSGGRKVPIATVENGKTEQRNGESYWTYETIMTGAPTITNRSKETYRHGLNVTAVRNGAEGTPFFYTLSLSCPQDQWEDLSALFDLCVASFRLTPVTESYVPPDQSSFPFL